MKSSRTSDKSEVTDWFHRFSYPIAEESFSKIGLRKRRESLEKFIAPHISTRKSPDVIRFERKRRYVKPITDPKVRHRVWFVIETLQAVYHLEDAWQEGDINDVVRLAYNLGMRDFEILTCEFFGCAPGSGLAALSNARRRGLAKRGKTKLKHLETAILESAYQNNFRKKDWLAAMLRELIERHKIVPVSLRTLSRELKKGGIVHK